VSERDVIELLAEANPVRVEDLPPLAPDIGVKVLDRRGRPSRRPTRRTALVGAVALAALASALIATFATGGRHSRPSTGSMETDLPPATVARPLAGAEVTLADASAAIGRPIVLPDTSFVSPADLGHAWVSGTFPNVTVAVNFPSRGLFIQYTAPPPLADMSASYKEIAQQDPHSFQTIDLNGGTALAVKQNSDETGHNFGGVAFVLDGLEIRVFGHYDEPTLQSIAQSIVDRESASGSVVGVGSGPTLVHPLQGGNLVTLPEAARAFDGEIIQPETAVMDASDAGAIWLVADKPYVRTVAITYPGADVWIDYSRPVSFDGGYDDQLLRFHASASRLTHTAVLDGVPAEVVFHSWQQARWRGFYPSVRFSAGGVNVVVWGHQEAATLEAIARSIVARSEKPPTGQLGDVGGVQLYPYLSHGRMISVSDASATLGSPVVLPDPSLASADRAQAWAEGSCPHLAADFATTKVCAVWVSFPGSDLSVGYIRPPAYRGTAPEWRLQARGLRGGGKAVHLFSRPALSIWRNAGAGFPGRVELDLAGTRIVVAGDYPPARLEAVARSIVERSRS
jgi:hypothetical protein